jgi:cell wall-associated NlpC family hydrolase
MPKPKKTAKPLPVTTESLVVPALFAERLIPGSENKVVRENLVTAIADIQTETQTVGANCLKLTISDPALTLISNGLFCANPDGSLPTVDLELDGVSYRLTDIEGTTDLSQPNLTMEFQTLGAVILREKYGHPHAKRGAKMTRAEFIRAQMHSVKADAHVPFICPALEVVQPIGAETQKIHAKARAEKKHKGIASSSQLLASSGSGKTVKAFKEPKGKIGNNTIGAPASLNSVESKSKTQQAKNLTIKGSKISAQQEKVANELLDTAKQLQAGKASTEAVVFAAIGESTMGAEPGPTEGGGTLHYGTLQGNEEPQWTTTEQATKFFKGTSPFQGGNGALALEKGGTTDPIKIAETVEGGGAYPNSENNLKEAQALIVAYGGVAGGTTVSKGSTTSSEGQYEFEITEEEDYWTGLNKLAQEVDWLLWFEGNTCYYMNSYELVTAKPLCVIDVVANELVTDAKIDPATGKRTYDKNHHVEKGVVSNFTFDYGGTGNTGTNAKSSSEGAVGGVSTECTIDLTCSPNFVCAGDVIMLTDPNGAGPWSTGPYNGRWVVTNATRSIFNTYTALTLAIPGTTNLPAPEDEPKAPEIINTNASSPASPAGSHTSANASSPGSEAEAAGASKATGGNSELRNKIVANAIYAARLEKEKSLYEYTETGSRNFKEMSLFNIQAPLTHIQLDCSGFCMLVYKECGAPDPNASGYVGGNTFSMQAHGHKTSTPQPGDIVFFFNPSHAAIYIGNGKCVSMGSQGEPVVTTVANEAAFHQGVDGYWNFLESGAVAENVHQAEVTTSQGGNPTAEQEAGEMTIGT